MAARHLEAALDLRRDVLERRPTRRARKALRALRRALGATGEAHAALGLLSERLPQLEAEARAVALHVVAGTQRELERLDAKAAKLCSRPATKRLVRSVERAWPRSADSELTSGSWLRRALARTEARGERSREAIQEVQTETTDDSLHEARVAIKRWRYSAERLAALTPEGRVRGRQQLKAIQDALGRIQDVRVLRERIAREVARLDPVELRSALTGLASLLESLETERSARVEEFFQAIRSERVGHDPIRVIPIERAGPSRTGS